MIKQSDVQEIHKLLIDHFGGSHGIKRTGYVLARLLLLKSGLDINATQTEKYKMVLSVSTGEWKFEQVRDWLRERCTSKK